MSTCSANITGTAAGTLCVGYGDCDPTCCIETPEGCDGINTHNCGVYGGAPTCNADPCCEWDFAGVGVCQAKACSDVDPDDCETCGCNTTGGCEARTCAQVAAVDNNPDVCEGCDTCPGNWSIDDSRGDLPWDVTVTGYTRITTPSGYARAGYPGKLISQSGIKWTPGGTRFKWKPGSLCKFKD